MKSIFLTDQFLYQLGFEKSIFWSIFWWPNKYIIFRGPWKNQKIFEKIDCWNKLLWNTKMGTKARKRPEIPIKIGRKSIIFAKINFLIKFFKLTFNRSKFFLKFGKIGITLKGACLQFPIKESSLLLNIKGLTYT